MSKYHGNGASITNNFRVVIQFTIELILYKHGCAILNTKVINAIV